MNDNHDTKGVYIPNWVLDFLERCRCYMTKDSFFLVLELITSSLRDESGVNFYEDDDKD